MWDADGLQVLHRRAQRAVVDVLVALEADVADLNLRALAHHERDADSRRGNGANLGSNRRELPPMLREQSLQRHFRFLDLGGVVLVLDRKPDLAFLETIEHIAGRNRTQSNVVDLAD